MIKTDTSVNAHNQAILKLYTRPEWGLRLDSIFRMYNLEAGFKDYWNFNTWSSFSSINRIHSLWSTMYGTQFALLVMAVLILGTRSGLGRRWLLLDKDSVTAWVYDRINYSLSVGLNRRDFDHGQWSLKEGRRGLARHRWGTDHRRVITQGA